MKQKDGFIGMLWDILSARLLGNLLTGKWVIGVGEDTIRATEGTIRAGQGF